MHTTAPAAALNLPQPLEVQSVDHPDGRQPVAVHWRGRWRRVEAIANVWRVSDEWWRAVAERQYVLVDLEGGMRLTLFEDLLLCAWYTRRGNH